MAVSMLLLAACLWGVSIPVMKALGAEQTLLSPGTGSVAASAAALSVRFGIAALALALGLGRWPARIRFSEWKHGCILGAITSASMWLQVDGLNYTGASTAGFLIALYSVLVPLIAAAAGWRRPTVLLAASCALVVAGLAVLTRINPLAFALGRGEWENLGAAALFAAQILWVGRIPHGSVDPGRMTLVLCVSVSALCLIPVTLSAEGLATLARVHDSGRTHLLTLFLALGGTAAPFLLMNRFQTRVGAVSAGFLYCFEPIAAALGALFLPELLVRQASLYPNETWTARLWLGGGLVTAANLLLLLDKVDSPPK